MVKVRFRVRVSFIFMVRVLLCFGLRVKGMVRVRIRFTVGKLVIVYGRSCGHTWMHGKLMEVPIGTREVNGALPVL